MEPRFAGEQASLTDLTRAELIRQLQLEMVAQFLMGRERDRIRESMRFRSDKLMGESPAQLMGIGWSDGTGADRGY